MVDFWKTEATGIAASSGLLEFFSCISQPNEVGREYLPNGENRRNSLQRVDQDLSLHRVLEYQRETHPPFQVLYPNKLKNWDFGFEKAPGLNDRKLPYIV